MSGTKRSSPEHRGAKDAPERRGARDAEAIRADRLSLKAQAKEAKNAAKETAKLKAQGIVSDATTRVATAVVTRLDDDRPEPPWWQAKRGKPHKTPLSRDAIIDAAIRILDAEGVDALTIRRLATDLETGPATLYWHISGKDELGELVYDRIMGAIELPEPDVQHWQAQLKGVVRDCYHVLLSHNDAVKLSIGQVPMGPNMLRIMEWMFGLIRGARVPDAVAAYFGDLIGRYVDASVLEQAAIPNLGGEDLGHDEAMAMVASYFASLPPAQFPNITSMSGAMFSLDDEARFNLGLDILIRGLEAYIESR